MAKTALAKVVRRVSLKEQPSDFAYWQGQTYQARLAAVEEIRQEYHRWRYDSKPRLQRSYTIIKR